MQKYSFLMCVYVKDDPGFLVQSIDSMLAQTAPADEIVIVEDGPLTDELYAVLEKYDKEHPGLFTFVKNEVNVGLGKALNVGIKHARNELLARMDADDICVAERCELQLKEFEKQPDLDIVGTSTCVFYDDPDKIIAVSHAATTQKAIYERGKKHAAFPHVTVMYRKSTLEKYGGYGEYRRAQDADLFGRMLYGGCKGINIDKPLVKVRKDIGLASRKKSKTNIDCILAIRKSQMKMGYISRKDYMSLWCKYRISSLVPKGVYQKVYMNRYKDKGQK